MVMVTQHFVSNQSLVHNNNIPESATAAAFWCGGSQIKNQTILQHSKLLYIVTKCVNFLLDNADDSQPRIHISNHNNNNYHKNWECTNRNSHSTTMASSGNGRVLVAPFFYAFPPSVVLPPAPLPSTKSHHQQYEWLHLQPAPSAVWMVTARWMTGWATTPAMMSILSMNLVIPTQWSRGSNWMVIIITNERGKNAKKIGIHATRTFRHYCSKHGSPYWQIYI